MSRLPEPGSAHMDFSFHRADLLAISGETHYILQNIPKKLMRDALLSHLKQDTLKVSRAPRLHRNVLRMYKEGIAAISISMPMDPKQKLSRRVLLRGTQGQRVDDLVPR